MKTVVTLVAIAGCNQTFGLHDVTLRDAPPDAPSTCPPFGEVPRYTPPQQFLANLCTNYERDRAGDIAVARCSDGVHVAIVVGPIDGPLDTYVSGNDLPRLDPDGSALYTRDGSANVVRFQRAGTTFVSDGIVFDLGTVGVISTLARSDDEVRLITTPNPAVEIQEWSGHGASWTKVGAPYPLASLGLATVSGLTFTADGLRVIADGMTGIGALHQMMYFDRATLDDRFGTSQPIGLPTVDDAFITADCTQVYYSGLERVFFSDRTR